MLKRNYNEIKESKEFDINSVNDVKSKLDRKKQRLLGISHEMTGINMQIKCLEIRLKKLCNHNWCKVKEDTGMYNRPPLECSSCGLIKSVAQG